MTKDEFVAEMSAIAKKGKYLSSQVPDIAGDPRCGLKRYNDPEITKWFAGAEHLLAIALGYNSPLFRQFKKAESLQLVRERLDNAIAILESAVENVAAGRASANLEKTASALDHIEQICESFYGVAMSLKSRREGRPPLVMADEYDVQYLLHAILRSHFVDVRPEEWTPSYAGGSARMDFLLKAEKLVVEVKRARQTLKAADLGAELLADIGRYKEHPDCHTLTCFVYDPEGLIGNPRGIESDLESHGKIAGLAVRVFIRPR